MWLGVEIESFKRQLSKNEVLIRCDWYPHMKEEFRSRDTHRGKMTGRQPSLSPGEKPGTDPSLTDLRRIPPYWSINQTWSVSNFQNWETRNVCCFNSPTPPPTLSVVPTMASQEHYYILCDSPGPWTSPNLETAPQPPKGKWTTPPSSFLSVFSGILLIRPY